MRILVSLLVALLGAQVASGQAPKELIAKFRKTIGVDEAAFSVPYMIHYRGERYFYTVRDGRVHGDAYPFVTKRSGLASTAGTYFRKEQEIKVGIVPLKLVEVMKGDSGWYQINEGEAVPMSKEEVAAREQRELQIEIFLGRESFDQADWKFSEPKSAQVRGKDAWMFEVREGKHEPIILYFARQSGLLVRVKTKTTDFIWQVGDRPKVESLVRDMYLGEWKKFGKRMLPGDIQVFHDGVLAQQMEPVNISFPERFDPKYFDAPQPKK